MTHGTLKIAKSHPVGSDYQSILLTQLYYNSDIYRDLPAGEVETEIFGQKKKMTCASIILASPVAHQTRSKRSL